MAQQDSHQPQGQHWGLWDQWDRGQQEGAPHPQPPPAGGAIREAINYQFVIQLRASCLCFAFKTISVGSKWCLGFIKSCGALRAANGAGWDFQQYPCAHPNLEDQRNLYHWTNSEITLCAELSLALLGWWLDSTTSELFSNLKGSVTLQMLLGIKIFIFIFLVSQLKQTKKQTNKAWGLQWVQQLLIRCSF